jgi:hypothetical protein
MLVFGSVPLDILCYKKDKPLKSDECLRTFIGTLMSILIWGYPQINKKLEMFCERNL